MSSERHACFLYIYPTINAENDVMRTLVCSYDKKLITLPQLQ